MYKQTIITCKDLNLQKVNKIIELLDELKQESPEFKVTIETMDQCTSCEIGEANIYLGVDNSLVIDAE